MALSYLVAGALLFVTTLILYRRGDNDRRRTALKRLFFGVPYFVIMFFVGSVFGALLVSLWILDTGWEFVTGREGFRPGGQAERLWEYRDSWVRYIVYGDGARPGLVP
jgi:hypothetical protein